MHHVCPSLTAQGVGDNWYRPVSIASPCRLAHGWQVLRVRVWASGCSKRLTRCRNGQGVLVTRSYGFLNSQQLRPKGEYVALHISSYDQVHTPGFT